MFVPFEHLPKVCGAVVPEGKVLLGCVRETTTGLKVMFLPDACPAAENGELYARIVCHETAHALGGWSGNHEF